MRHPSTLAYEGGAPAYLWQPIRVAKAHSSTLHVLRGGRSFIADTATSFPPQPHTFQFSRCPDTLRFSEQGRLSFLGDGPFHPRAKAPGLSRLRHEDCKFGKMALGIKHGLLRELRHRVLIYERWTSIENRDQVIVAARAVARNYGTALEQTLARQNESRRKVSAERLAAGLCRICGKRPRVPDRTGCVKCLRKNADAAKRMRKS